MLLVRDHTLGTTGLWEQSKKNRMLGFFWIAKDEPNINRQGRKKSAFLLGTTTRVGHI